MRQLGPGDAEEMAALHNMLTHMFDGYTLEVVMYSCSTIIAHAMLQIPEDRRDGLMRSLGNFIQKTIKDLEPCGTKPN